MGKRFRMITTRHGKLKGLLGKKPTDEIVVLVPCNDIHTYGMRHDLSIAFVNSQGIVLETYRKVPPRSRLRHKQAAAVIEGFEACHRTWFTKGDHCMLVQNEEGKTL